MNKSSKKILRYGKYLLYVIVMVVFGWLMCSCKTVQYVPVVEKEVIHDSIYLTKLQKDSVWLHDSIRIEAKNDTVRIEKWHTRYVDRLRVDTVVKYKTDSVPKPYPVPQYIEKPMKWYHKAFMWTGILALMAMTLICGRWFSKHV